MLQLSMTTRSVMNSHRATWTSLIIVVRLHAFKNDALLRSKAAEDTGNRVGYQDLALGEARCVGLCAGSDATSQV
jgi:hypothetical protein